ncbi:restriction endonuclease subunit S [Glaesserella parasuis]|uniref:restriction endonuclease subunit S n=1 Tax=Glaesserella parasuis TaxID=738 RepID=UPI0027290B8C|nr:restriction endonuclease subunit S [Glaesserella parasuis]
MIESRFIEKLLKNREIEFKSLGDVTEMKRGKTITAKDASGGDIPVISGGQKPAYYHNEYNRNGKTITVAGSGAYAGFIMYWEEPIFVSDAFSIKSDETLLDLKYVYHFLLQHQQKIYGMKKGSGVPHVYPKDLSTLVIPIPPLDVQQEIVRILDAFTSLTAELTSRQKQYQYFKEHLLNINNNIVWKSLSEITITTKNIKWENNKKNYRYIDLTSVNRENNRITETIEINAKNAPSRAQKIIEKNDILFATTRPTQQRMTIVPEEYDSQIASTGYCVLRPNKEEVLPEWIYYNISTIDFKNYVEEYQSGSAYPAISDYKVKEYKIPIPSIQMQEKLISILNRFEELTHSIEAGLPSEIQLRKQQYEYYRNMLLNFK